MSQNLESGYADTVIFHEEDAIMNSNNKNEKEKKWVS